MNKRKQFAVVFAAAAIAAGVIFLFAFSMQAEEARRQAIYDVAVAERQQRIEDRLKAEEPEKLEAEREKALVEKARADAEEAPKRPNEAFKKNVQEHGVPDIFRASDEASSEAPPEEHLLNCSYEYELEQKLKAEKKNSNEYSEEDLDEISEEVSVSENVDLADQSFDWSSLYGKDQYETFVFTIYSEVGGENPETDSQMIQAVAQAFLNNLRLYGRSPKQEAFKWPGAYSNCNCETGEIFCGEAENVSWELVYKEPEWLELVSACWTGEAEQIIPMDYDSFLTPSLLGYEYLPVSVFAEDHGIEEFVELYSTNGNGIFFNKKYMPY